MGSVNRVTLVGHLGSDPEVKFSNAGLAIANIRLATNETTGKGDDKKDHVEWHRITAFGKLAEICGKFLVKGSQAYFEGRLQTRQWEDRDGNKRYTTEIIADKMVMLGGKSESTAAPAPDTKPPEDDVPF